MVKNISLRIGAVFAYSAMAIIGGASMLGDIPVWKAAVLAGISATAQVMERLARAFADDGELTLDEINEAFAGHRIDSAE